MFRLTCLIIGYIFGNIQSAYIAGRLSGVDIRAHGSGNLGTTNTVRVLGRKAGVAVFLADIFKTIAAFVVATLIFDGGGAFFASDFVLPGLYAGIGAVLGHVYPIVLKFKGGKGIACALTIILMMDLWVALALFAMGVVIVATTRYISTASLAITALAPVAMFFFDYSIEAVALTAGLAGLAWYLHRGNIQRLINGNENKFTFSRAEKV